MATRFITKLAHAIARENPRRFINVVTIYALLCLPILLIALVSFCNIYKNITGLSLSQERNIPVPIALALSNRINQIVDDGKSIAIHPQVREFVAEDKWNEAMEVIKIFHYVTEEPFIDRIALLSRDGILKSSIPETSTIGQNFSHRD